MIVDGFGGSFLGKVGIFVRVKSACVCACANEKGSDVELEKFENIKKLIKLRVRS